MVSFRIIHIFSTMLQPHPISETHLETTSLIIQIVNEIITGLIDIPGHV